MNFVAAGLSDVGLQREHNEDSFCILPEHRLFVVADGRRIEATQCDAQAASSSTRPAWCDADQTAHIMEEGDRFEVSFEVGDAKEVELYARGYYIPLSGE